jgi:predicted ATPase/class 3 adenylate cyclase
MQCPKCQFENREGAKFCKDCGDKLELLCPGCGQGYELGSKFCDECGHNLTAPQESKPLPKDLSPEDKVAKIQRYLPQGLAEKILSQRDKIEGERKNVTVMFCDLEGFTPLAEKLGPEESYALVNPIYEILIHGTQDYGGTVNEMTGDGIVALFGAPVALEDAPQRAIRSSLAIHREMARFNDKMKQERPGLPTLKMRVGIHTGPVVVGTVGNDLRVEFKAVGDTVNLASRMEGLAEPGTTYVSGETFKFTEGLFRFEGLGEKAFKGKEEAVPVYRVIAPSTRRTRFDVAAERGLTPFVGRQRELELLHDALDRAKDGQGQAVSIVAPAGDGKSRILYEFRKGVTNEDVTFLEGKCLSYSRGVAYHPVIDILRGNFDIREDDGDEVVRNKVRRGLKAIGADDEATRPYILELLSVKDSGIENIPMSPEARKDRTIQALNRIVLKGAEIRPLIVSVEDLHWMDPSSEDVFRDLLEHIAGARVLLLFTYRPEYVHTWGGRSYHSQVNLNRLSNREALAMAAHLLGTETISAELENLILEKTEGVPFFVEEFLKSLQGLRIIEREDNTSVLAQGPQQVAIPATIQDVIMARVDSLPEGAKGLLQTGSVAGREFSYDLIKMVTGLAEQQLLSHLSVLKDSELVYERGIHPESAYVFKHALTQEATYQSLMKNARQRCHREIAQILEKHFPGMVDAQPELLGYHFAEAGHVEQAMPHIQRAGERAIQRFANVEAIAHLTKALELIKALPGSHHKNRQELALCISLGQTYTTIKGFAAPEIELVYTRARKLCERVGSRSDQFSVLQGEWVFHQSRARHQKARETSEGLLRLAEIQHDSSLLMQAHCTLGISLHYLGKLVAALEHFEMGMAHYESRRDSSHSFVLGRSNPKIFYGIFITRILWLCGYPDRALQKSHEMLALAKELSHPYSIVEALLIITRVHQCRREGQQALKHAEQLLELSTEHGFAMRTAQATFLKGWALAAEEEPKKGVEDMRRGLAAWRATGAETHVPDFLALIAEICGKIGEIEEGLQLLDEALTLVENTKECWWEAELQRLKGDLLMASDANNQAEAEECYHQAIAVSRHQQAKSLELRTAISLARLWQSQGKPDDARELLAPIYGWFTEGFDTADLQDAKASLEESSA